MRIRSIGTDELDLFIDAAGYSDHPKEVEQYLDRMFAPGSMRPEWCFIAEEGDRPVGRVALWIPARDRGFPVRGGPGSARTNRSRRLVPSPARRRARYRRDIWGRAV